MTGAFFMCDRNIKRNLKFSVFCSTDKQSALE